MKTFDVTDKIRNIEFDDEIVGTFTKAQYTHDVDGHKQFLLFHLINNEWTAQPIFGIGIKNTVDMIIFRDRKELIKNKNNENI